MKIPTAKDVQHSKYYVDVLQKKERKEKMGNEKDIGYFKSKDHICFLTKKVYE